MERLNELKERYQKNLGEVYLNRERKYLLEPDYILVDRKYSIGGYCEGTFKKVFMSDVDNTITKGETLSEKWIYWLSEIKEFTSSVREELLECINSIPLLKDRPSIKQTIERLSKRLKESKLHHQEHIEASIQAANKLELVPFSEDFIRELEGMGYVVSLNSGSPQRCVEELGKKLGVTKRSIGLNGVYEKIFGTVYKFDVNGYFTGKVEECLGQNKEIKVENVMNNTGCSPFLSIFVSDDPSSDMAPASKAGYAIWVDLGKSDSIPKEIIKRLREVGLSIGIYKLPGKFSIYCPEARENMINLLDCIKRVEYLNFIMCSRTPETQKRLYELVKKFEKVTEIGLKSKENFPIHKIEFLDLAHQIQGFVKYLYTDRSLNVSNSLQELKNSADVEMDKSLMNDIFYTFKKAMAEFQVPENVIKELDKIVEEKKLFNDLDWWLP